MYRAVKDEVTRVGGGRVRSTLLAGRFLDLGLKIQATVYGFGPQNLGGPWRTGRHVAASGGLRRGEAKDEEGAWPSDQLPRLP